MIEVKKGFGPGNDAAVMSRRAAYGQRSPAARTAGYTADELSGVRAEDLKEISRHAGRPVRSPIRDQADPSGMIIAGEIICVVILAEPQFVLRLAAKGSEANARILAGRVKIQR